jgi:predicted dehydrogenase
MNERLSVTRRQLLKRGATLAAASVAAPYMLTGRALGDAASQPAANRIGVGFIGVGGMGRGHLGDFLRFPDVQVVAIADVHEQSRNEAMKMIRQAYGKEIPAHNDYRDLLARKDVDAVVIATPDHWHALAAIHACQAGKDVYCEKPLSLTIREAQRMVRAARANATVFQTGSQQRSSSNFRLACELVRSGRVGKVQWVRACVGSGPTCGWEPNVPPPPGLDWNLWLGPAPWAEYTPKRCLSSFRWFYDYAGGMMTDWGAHHNDIAQWGLGMDHSGPVQTEPVSVTFPTDGLFDTATDFEVKHTYANGVVLYTASAGRNGIRFQGTDGWIQVGRGYLEASQPTILSEPLGPGDVHLYRSPQDDLVGHERDFLNCVRTRKRPICDVEIGCRSVTVCHLGNIAIRTGKTVRWDPAGEEITNDPSLERWLDKPYRGPWRA